MNRFLMLTFVMLLMCMLLMSSDVYAAVIQIDSIEELQKIGNDTAYPVYGEYELTQDIDASDTINWNDGAGFKPVGTSDTPFLGKFNGNGHKIADLYINRSGEAHIGLFGYISSRSEVKNLGIKDCWIIGGSYVGGLVGYNYEGSITISYSTGAVSGVDRVGGLVGENNWGGSITSSYSTGAVSGSYDVGGLVGENDGNIKDSYSTGSVFGFRYVGGLVGSNDYSGSITSSYWNKETSGQSSSAGGEGKTTAEMKQQATYIDWDFVNIWAIEEGVSYPYLRELGPTQGSTPLVVETKEIRSLGELSKIGKVPEYPWWWNYELIVDIDASDTLNWNGGKGFKPLLLVGKFDGNGHVIRNLYINRDSEGYVGLFGILGSGGEVRDLGVEDCWIVGNYYVGGLVGINDGSITSSYSTGAVSGSYDVGGLVGENDGNIKDSYSTGSVSGYGRVGGLVGSNGSSFFDIIGNITSSYSTGAVSGSDCVGGLVGYSRGSITSSYWDVETSGIYTSAGGEWKTTEQMKQKATYVGWDFVNVWNIVEGVTYPFFREIYEPKIIILGETELTTECGEEYIDAGATAYDIPDGDLTEQIEITNNVNIEVVGDYTVAYSVTDSSNSTSIATRIVHVVDTTKPVITLLGANPMTVECHTSFSDPGATATDTCDNEVTVDIVSNNVDTSRTGTYQVVYRAVDDSGNTEEATREVHVDCGGEGTLEGSVEGTAEGVVEGEGTTEVITINSIEELQKIGNDANYPLNGIYELTQDIDASDTINWNDGAGFKPIGTSDTPFLGKFNGNGHKITGLSINRSGEDYVGLFGYIGSGAEVKNLGIEDCWIIGDWNVGGLVGENRGSITSSYSTGAVSGTGAVGGLVGDNVGSITSSYSTVAVSGSGEYYYVGGLVGANYYGNITSSYSTGVVYGDYGVGGLVGGNYGSITSSYSTGAVSGDEGVGGLVGVVYNDGSITSSYSTGAVYGDSYVGGLVGYNGGSITSSYWDKETSGQSSSAGGEGKTTAEMKQQTTYIGWDFTNIWAIEEGLSYPYLRVLGPTVEIPAKEIRSIEELGKIGVDRGYPLWGNYELVSDIDASATLNWNDGKGFMPIGTQESPFLGKFNGKGYKIIGLHINRPDETGVGLFGYIDSPCEIRNLGLEGCEVIGSTEVGGLVGYKSGGFITNNYNKGIVSGNSYVGGLVGRNIGGVSIRTCYSISNVSGSSDYVGGLVGENSSSVDNSYCGGVITGSSYVGGIVGYNFGGSVNNSYSIAWVSGEGSYIGGLIGENDSGTISNSYWDKEVSGRSTSGGGVGKTTAQMKQQATYVGWDFVNIWTIIEGQSYPYLVWQQTPPEIEGEGTTEGEGEGQVTNVSVPNVLGKTEAEARSAIVAAGLTVGTVTQEYSSTVPQGQVISQNPTAGTEVAAGTGVNIVISRGAGAVVPDVVGKTEAEARSAITAAGLAVGIIMEGYSDTVSQGQVISQNPLPATVVTPGTAVDLVISKGPSNMVTVPYLVGRSKEEAEAMIQSVGLVADVKQECSDYVSAGLVIRQSPIAYSSVTNETNVTIWISTGACETRVAVPNVVGKSEADASSAIAGVGLLVSKTEQYSDIVVAGLVMGQSPVAGSMIESGAVVEIVVSKGSAPTGTTKISQPQGLEAYSGVDHIYLVWRANTERNLSGYRLERSETGAGNWVSVSGDIITETRYRDTGINLEQAWYYRVIAIGQGGEESEPSTVVRVEPGKLQVWVSDIDWLPAGSNDMLQVPISISRVQGLEPYIIDVEVSYASAVLELVDVQRTAVSRNMQVFLDTSTEPGVVKFHAGPRMDTEEKILYGEGHLFDLVFKVKQATGAESCVQETDIKLEKVMIQDTNLGEISVFPQNGGLNVLEENPDTGCVSGHCIYGDLDTNGYVGMGDAVMLLRKVVRKAVVEDWACDLRRGDFNGDKILDCADASLLMRKLSGLPINPTVSSLITAVDRSIDVVVDNQVPDTNNEYKVGIDLSPLKDVSGVDLLLSYDAGIVFSRLELGEATSKFKIETAVGEGYLKVSIGSEKAIASEGGGRILNVYFSPETATLSKTVKIDVRDVKVKGEFGDDMSWYGDINIKNGSITLTSIDVEQVKNDLKANFDTVDTDKDGKISYAELSAYNSSVTQDVFDSIAGNDGYIDRSEVGLTVSEGEGTAEGEGGVEGTVDGAQEGTHEGEGEGQDGGEDGCGCGCSGDKGMPSFDGIMKYLLDFLLVGFLVSLMSAMKKQSKL